MIRIGDFAKLSRVSVKTLRHYDELGLIRPVRVDEFTGYRYYEYEQYPLMSRIRALKDLGFSLEEIGRLLDVGMTSDQMQTMLRLRGAEIHQRIADEQGRLARLDAWLRQLERNETVTYNVVIKRVDPVLAATVRGVVPQPADQGRMWQQLLRTLDENRATPAGPCISLYYDEEPPDRDWDIEVAMAFEGRMDASDGVHVRELPAVEMMATVVHAGPYMTINEAYASLWMWAGQNGFRVAGPAREVLLRAPKPEGEGASQTDPDTIVEVQFPVEKSTQ